MFFVKMAQNYTPVIEKLKGRENYNTWKFGMQAYLEHEDLWGCIQGIEAYTQDAKKDIKAKSKIILTVDPINYVHIQETTTAKETWDKLQRAFEDNGLTRKVGLLRTLVTTQLNSCSSVDEYVNRIITTAHKLDGIGFKIPDEWVGTLLLAGLPEEYKPMIMGIENSGTAITADSIKTKLLQDIQNSSAGSSSHNAAALLPHRTIDRDKVRCYACNKFGHYASNCNSKNKKFNKGIERKKTSDWNKGKSTSKYKAESSFFVFAASNQQYTGVWSVDSCASCHRIANSEWLKNPKECRNIEISA